MEDLSLIPNIPKGLIPTTDVHKATHIYLSFVGCIEVIGPNTYENVSASIGRAAAMALFYDAARAGHLFIADTSEPSYEDIKQQLIHN